MTSPWLVIPAPPGAGQNQPEPGCYTTPPHTSKLFKTSCYPHTKQRCPLLHHLEQLKPRLHQSFITIANFQTSRDSTRSSTMSATIHVKNISSQTSEQEVRDFFGFW